VRRPPRPPPERFAFRRADLRPARSAEIFALCRGGGRRFGRASPKTALKKTDHFPSLVQKNKILFNLD